MFRPSLSRVAQGHGLGGGGGFVEQRGVGDVQAGQVDDHGLEVQQRFEPALGDFGLVGRVGGVPAGVLQHVALNDGGRDAVVVAHADVGAEDLVLGGDFLQRRQHFVLAAGSGKRERAPAGESETARRRPSAHRGSDSRAGRASAGSPRRPVQCAGAGTDPGAPANRSLRDSPLPWHSAS